jgi:hypothetical protein
MIKMILSALILMISAAAALSGCAAFNQQASDIFESYKFPSYDRATHLCGENVLANVAEITWDAFSSEDSVEKVISFYEKKLGKEGFKREGAGGGWKFPIDSDRPERIIEIMPTGAKAPYQECENKPPPSSKSIIIVSRIIRKK